MQEFPQQPNQTTGQSYPQQGYAPMYQYPPMPPQTQQQPGQPFAQQPYYPPQPMMATNMMQTNVNVNVKASGPGFFVRALYFCFVGWWAGWFCLNLGFFLCSLIITLPAGLMILNRIPQIMTLKTKGIETNVNVSTTSLQTGNNSFMQTNVNVTVGGTAQLNFLLRALYFCFIGCWAVYIWANIAYGLCLTVFLLPVGVMMFNMLPAVLTLRKN